MHKVKTNERRYAQASAIAASSNSALVMARGHRVERLNELPFVVSDDIQSYVKTKQAFQFLRRANAGLDLSRSKNSRKIRTGKGKNRGARRYVQRVGPLIIYKESKGIEKAFRNIPGVSCAKVDQLNLLQLAPGGHVGRFIIWTESAFKELNARFGTYGAKGDSKFHRRNGQVTYRLPRPVMQNTDVERILQSDEIQSVVRDRKIPSSRRYIKKNPLKNLYAMIKLNPLAAVQKRKELRKDDPKPREKKPEKK